MRRWGTNRRPKILYISTGQESRSSSYIKYYQGLSFLKLGKKKEADEDF